jgi:menaquinone-dependent protoporphyrinogen IX oxidase
LGPTVIERATYIRPALDDHLLVLQIYQRLTEQESTTRLKLVCTKIYSFVRKHQSVLGKDKVKFLRHSLVVSDPFPHFYITAKIQKKPWKTRPIVSVGGSISHGLGRCVDNALQPICCKLPTYLESSLTLVDLFKS